MRQANLKRAAGINHGLLKAFIICTGHAAPILSTPTQHRSMQWASIWSPTSIPGTGIIDIGTERQCERHVLKPKA